MKFTTLIPLRFNDGQDVPLEQMNRIIDQLAFQFRGCSDEGITKGQWLDPEDSRVYRDDSRRISIICDSSRLMEAREAVIKIGQVLHQLVMYFEVRDYDGVYLLDIRELRKRKRK